jgi:hypothetical protein
VPLVQLRSRHYFPAADNMRRSMQIRLIIYVLIFLLYLLFMENFAPRGISWADYHSQSVFNAVEFLRLHGYFENFGFSIWTSCTDCDLGTKDSHNIYVSFNSITYLPFIFLNEVGGKPFLLLYGPHIDRLIIFLTAVLCTEVCSQSLSPNNKVPGLFIRVVFFTLFVTSVWTYLMLRAAWHEIWFLFLFAAYLYSILKDQIRRGLVFFFLSCLVHPMWGLLTGAVVLGLLTLSNFFAERERIRSQFFFSNFKNKYIFIMGLSAIVTSTLMFYLSRLVIEKNPGRTEGSSLLWRIGISGDDVHNGGVLGALQFLGGVRITKCFGDFSFIRAGDLAERIFVFNCFLSISSLGLLSIVATIGAIVAIIKENHIRVILFPICISFLTVLMVLQQSNSVHLLGYSYIFSLVFAVGMAYIFQQVSLKLQSRAVSIVVLSPLAVGLILLSIRVSMLD